MHHKTQVVLFVEAKCLDFKIHVLVGHLIALKPVEILNTSTPALKARANTRNLPTHHVAPAPHDARLRLCARSPLQNQVKNIVTRNSLCFYFILRRHHRSSAPLQCSPHATRRPSVLTCNQNDNSHLFKIRCKTELALGTQRATRSALSVKTSYRYW